MVKKRLLIVANNAEWKTWQSKITLLKGFFSSRLDLSIDLRHTKFDTIPMTPQEGRADMLGVDPVWYDGYITPLAFGYDIVLFVVPSKQWPANNNAWGFRTDKDQGIVQLQISCDEQSTMYVPVYGMANQPSDAFYEEARHEILHALYMLTGQFDTTHQAAADYNRLDKARDALVFLEEIQTRDGIIAWMVATLKMIGLQIGMAQQTKYQVLAELNPPTPKPPVIEKDFVVELGDFAESCVGKDISLTQDALGCAESVSWLAHEVYKDIPSGILGTPALDAALAKHPKFKRVTVPRRGTIWVAVSGKGNGTMPHGHTGVFLDENMSASNDSETSLFKKNYTMARIIARYRVQGGFPINLYERKEA